ncbi:MAG: hypothetical protein ABFS05_12080 [Bacteroidota bacterium]
MEEFIYIILGVLWLAATIYRASKKKQQALPKKDTTGNIEEESHVSAKQSLLEQLLEGQQLKIPEPEVIEMEEEYAEPMMAEVEERRQKESFQTKYAGYGFRSLESLSGEGVRSLGDITFEDIMKEPKKKPRSAVSVDLRKAIIYKAILERPYT